MAKGRLVVGIDLGTTNTVVAWAERRAGAVPSVFKIPQLVSGTEIEQRALLPSLLYAPTPGEAAADLWGDAPWVLGEHARRRGVEVPGRLVASAKSWLCHPGVDRTAPILPWAAPADAVDLPRVSPVETSARVLSHVRTTWNAAFEADRLEDQEVVLTVPASFDEVARELTIEAAAAASLTVRLLEEPQAAFYDHMHRAGPESARSLVAEGADDALVLVCDVGGGTTDLSLIRVSRDAIERVAVGHHLLLGGDNMDLALAHQCEARLVQASSRLEPARFAQLVLACRAAKEKLLGIDPPDDLPITVLGSGSRLVGGALTTRLTRAEAESLVLDGFFPETPREARPERSKSALVAFGLPYERDVAITRHVAWFFSRHAPDVKGPRALLLNGGVFNAAGISTRLVAAIQGWGGPPIEVLPHADPDLAVARGAVAFGLALSGHGRRIEGGAARGYYLALEAPRDSAPGERTAVCVVPRGAKEGTRHAATGRPLALVVGRPVRFDLFASDDSRVHTPGEIVLIDDDRFQALPPVAVAFDAGAEKRGATEVRVALEGELTAIGTLDLACVELGPSTAGAQPRRFRLAFQLRPDAIPSARSRPPSQAPPSSRARRGRVDEAWEALLRVFGKGKKDVDEREAKGLIRELERLLGERASWDIETARALFDAIVIHTRARRRSADHERVFWSLAGYCLRPGFGHPLDAGRIETLAPLFAERVGFGLDVRVWQQFWIAWRRIAGGLGEATQVEIRDATDPFLAPPERKLKKPKGPKPEALAELCELVSSLERVPPTRRSELGGWILERTWTDRDPRLWAALGRLGARIPAYASVHHVVSTPVVERWLDHLLREKWPQASPGLRGDTPHPGAASPLLQAAVQMARLTGDRARDISERTRREVEKKLAASGAPETWIRVVREQVAVEEAERAAWFGDTLPAGLRLLSSD